MKQLASDSLTLATPKSHSFPFSALGTLFWLTLRQQARGRRWIVIGFLFLIPSLVAVLARTLEDNANIDLLEFALVFNLIPHALLPLAALLYSAGMIQDEVEEQTLTYLLVRPIPKWAIYLTKLFATLVTTVVLAMAFTTVTYATVHWGRPELWGDILPTKAVKTAGILALALVGYCAAFGCMSLFVRWILVVGIAYIILLEGLLASFDFAFRRLTVMFYYQVLCLRWLDADKWKDWSIDLETAPDAQRCVLTLLGAGVAATLLAMLLISSREFRMKTPEGS
jgi:ABC-2 type transport system permease protein